MKMGEEIMGGWGVWWRRGEGGIPEGLINRTPYGSCYCVATDFTASSTKYIKKIIEFLYKYGETNFHFKLLAIHKKMN
jgi:hypothetical protein